MHIIHKITLVSALFLFAACDRAEEQQVGDDLSRIGQDIEDGAQQVGQEIERGVQRVGEGAQEVGQDIEREVDSWDWNLWDENGDASVASGEFDQRADRMHTAWAGDDQRLTGDELATGMFASLDQNDDDALERTELTDQLVSAVGREQYRSYQAWDLDDGGRVEQSEFLQTFRDAGIYERWDEDSDGNVTQEELRQGWFQDFDRNRDRSIQRDEWGFEGGGV